MTECYSCGEEYDRLSLHWLRGSCDYPELSDKQYEFVKGLVMGDGYVKRRDGSPCQVRAEMNNEEFLSFTYKFLQPLSASISLHRTAKENAERNGRDSYSRYNNSFLYISRTAPTFNEFGSWYLEGGKRWPEDLSLTPTSLSVLYVCDGSLSGKTPTISCVKEKDREDFVTSLFENMGIEASMSGHHIRLSSEEFFETVGGPLPGFERKWIEGFKQEESVVGGTNGRL